MVVLGTVHCCKVKLAQAGLVLGWGTTGQVPQLTKPLKSSFEMTPPSNQVDWLFQLPGGGAAAGVKNA